MRLEASRFIAESYFEFHGENSINNVGTSKKLFSKHATKPSNAKLTSFLQQRPVTRLEEQILQLRETIKMELFPQWHLQLLAGSNLGFVGYGSKTIILDLFIEEYLRDWHVFRLSTFVKGSSYISLLHSICENVLDDDTLRPFSPRKDIITELTDSIVNGRLTTLLVIVIEMADGVSFRNTEIWKSLCRLSTVENIRLILTFEHINALLLNNEAIWTKLNLAWHDVTTFEPYSQELLGLLSMGSNAIDSESKWKGAQFVLSSLTRTARSVYRVLAEYQLAQSPPMDDSDDDDDDRQQNEEMRGIRVVAWYQQCQEQFLVSNEVAFRTQLTEFVDHELVKSVDDAGQNGTEFIIPFGRSQIEALLEICKSS